VAIGGTAISNNSSKRLITTYGTTALKMSPIDRVMTTAAWLRPPDAADWVRRLREVALRDENGTELDGAIKTVESFC
jgi:indolepyruvate ferredoxin oxidoreductase, beta subunit